MRSLDDHIAFLGSAAFGGCPPDFLQGRILCASELHSIFAAFRRTRRRLEFQTIHHLGFGTSRMKRAIAGLLCLLSILLLAYLFHVAKQIERESTIDEAGPADVIIVLGAAEYRGKPSPVLQGRLNHALLLYLRGLAPYILTTGGAGGDPDYTEGEVGRAYLSQHGVPSEAILVEPEGTTTAQSVDAAAEIMRRMDLHSCIVVSDGYHIYRVKRLLEWQHIKVYGSPRPPAGSPSQLELRWLYLRQAVGFFLWQAGINI